MKDVPAALVTNGPDIVVRLEDLNLALIAVDGVLRIEPWVRGDADLELQTTDGTSFFSLFSEDVRGWEAAGRVLARSGGQQWSAHPPFDVSPQPHTPDVLSQAELTIQHIKHDSPFGVLRYSETFRHGLMVERLGGVYPGYDVLVENSFCGMVHTLGSADLLDMSGGASVRARQSSSLLLLASVYNQPGYRAHVTKHQSTNLLLCILAMHTQTSAWQEAFGA